MEALKEVMPIHLHETRNLLLVVGCRGGGGVGKRDA